MKTSDFLRQHNACRDGTKWALSISKDMADVWDAMLAQGKHDWLIWAATRHGVFTESILRKLACRFVRETPLVDGRTVWDLLTNERSRKAVEVAEAYADGNATDGDLAEARQAAADAAYYAANAAYYDANAAYYAARAARAAEAAYASNAAYYASNAAYYAARAACASALAAEAAAKSAQIKMIAELGNPFKKGE